MTLGDIFITGFNQQDYQIGNILALKKYCFYIHNLKHCFTVVFSRLEYKQDCSIGESLSFAPSVILFEDNNGSRNVMISCGFYS